METMIDCHLCLQCAGDTKVIDSRARAEVWYRRRQCLECGHKFATYEVTKDQWEESATVVRSKLKRLKLLFAEIHDTLKVV